MNLTTPAAALWLGLAGGCSSGSGASADPASAHEQRVADVARELEAHYIVGPKAARDMGYHIDWQVQLDPYQNSGIQEISAQGDTIFVLDGSNFLSRLDRENGHRRWRSAVEDPAVAVQAVTLVPRNGNVVVTVGGQISLLDGVNGVPIRKQSLEQIASTAPIAYGGMIIYGSRTGQVVWHSHEVGARWRAYQIAPTIMVDPVLVDDRVYAVGSGGKLAVLDAKEVRMVWEKTLLDEVVAPPVIGEGMVFLAGTDQQLWAFRVNDGRRVWRYLAEAPLTTSPRLIDKQLYQRVPGVGLLCFNAMATSSPGGQILWTAKGVGGDVIAAGGGRLVVWDGSTRKMTILNAAQGSVVASIDLPQIDHLLSVDLAGSQIVAAANDGRIIRLSPM